VNQPDPRAVDQPVCQPVGPPVPGWTPRAAPGPVELTGRYVRLVPLTREHATALYAATCGPAREPDWTYLGEDMPPGLRRFEEYVDQRIARPGGTTLTVLPTGRGPEGLATWLRPDPANGVVEVGSLLFGPRLQRTTAATEAMWLMARHVFGLGYRRYEWKCDSLNAPSRAAAVRLGFSYEGTFANAVVYKGRSRDTAWYSITDREWEALTPAYEQWLRPANFEDPATGEGQRSSLSALTAAALATAPRRHDVGRGSHMLGRVTDWLDEGEGRRGR
jgi:RimJ/RimL family protein N-acetyltransferase